MALSDSRVLAESAAAGALDRLLAATHDDMALVNAMILSRASSHVEMVPELARYLIEAGGKRLRPMLTLAASALFGGGRGAEINYAAAVEFMHNATLLHDDVVDDSEMRRGRPAARMIWGNPASVLVGDFLLGQAFLMMVRRRDHRCPRHLGPGADDHRRGGRSVPARQGARIFRDDAGRIRPGDPRQDGDIVRGGGGSRRHRWPRGCGPHAAARYCAIMALELGLAFQLVDDVLDYRRRTRPARQEHRRRFARRQNDATGDPGAHRRQSGRARDHRGRARQAGCVGHRAGADRRDLQRDRHRTTSTSRSTKRTPPAAPGPWRPFSGPTAGPETQGRLPQATSPSSTSAGRTEGPGPKRKRGAPGSKRGCHASSFSGFGLADGGSSGRRGGSHTDKQHEHVVRWRARHAGGICRRQWPAWSPGIRRQGR